MRAGWLRHTIQIQQGTTSADGGGGGAVTFATITSGERKASITPVSSDEVFAEGQLQERVTHKITTRWLSGVTSGMRVRKKDDGRVFDIKSVINPSERREDLILRCVERMSA